MMKRYIFLFVFTAIVCLAGIAQTSTGIKMRLILHYDIEEVNGKPGYWCDCIITDNNGVLDDSYSNLQISFYEHTDVSVPFFSVNTTFSRHKATRFFLPKDIILNRAKQHLQATGVFDMKISYYAKLTSKKNCKEHYYSWKSLLTYDLLNAEMKIIDKYMFDFSIMNEPYRAEMQRKYSTEDLAVNEDDGSLIKVQYNNRLTAPDNMEIRICFWHNVEMTDSVIFYEYIDKKDTKGHPVLLSNNAFSKDWDKEIAPHIRRTNSIKRSRSNMEDFIFFMPSYIIQFAEYDKERKAKGLNDTIFADVRAYRNNQEIGVSHCYLYWVRESEKDTSCHHPNMIYEEINIKKEKLSDTETIETYDVVSRCPDCGYENTTKNLTRFAGEEERTIGFCPPHFWERYLGSSKFNEGLDSIDGDCVRKCLEANVIRKCIICGKIEETDIVEQYWQRNCKCWVSESIKDISSKTVERYKVITNTIETLRNCEGVETILGTRTETRWEKLPCNHPNMKLVNEVEVANTPHRFYHTTDILYEYQCSDCGYKEYREGKENHFHKKEKAYVHCQRLQPFSAKVGGVPLKMHIAVNNSDSSAVYIAETETTEALWEAVYPSTNENWKNSQYPVTNVTLNDVKGFISALNYKAETENWPLRFRLPTVDEWLYAYDFGGDYKEGWTHCPTVHKVAEKEKDEMGLYDMLGNVSEICDNNTSIEVDEGEYEYWTAVAGNSYCGIKTPKEVRYHNLDKGEENVGFRLFADPVPSNEDKDQECIEISVGERAIQIGYKWSIQNVYKCSVCGRLLYGPKHYRHWNVNNAPKGCGCN
ncbi:MAG: formylglycine-generating enzyme family protein [Prevotella sp.]